MLPACALALLVAGCGDATERAPTAPDPGGVELHANLMAFLQAPPPTWQKEPPVQPALSLQFEYGGDYVVTDGQPWQGVTTQGGTPGSPLEITALAGRHKSVPPEEFFNEYTHLVLGYAFVDDRPSELNFAFSGNLVINGSSYPIYLGQGSSLFETDWWFGVPILPADEKPWTQDTSGYLHTPDGKYVICPKNGGYFGAHDNAFQVITPDLTVNCEEA